MIVFFDSVRGQSAIEYLMTYGWMLLVVAIVGGAIFSIAQSEDVESVNGFTGGDLTVDDFGTTSDGDLQLVMRNTAAETVDINSINVSNNDGNWTEWNGSQSVSVGNTESVTLPNVTEGDSANNLDVTSIYDVGGLEDLEVSGSISGSFEITESGSSVSDDEEVVSEPNSESGTVSLDELDGDGTEEDPYVIMNDQELQAMNEELDAHYKLGQNIDASLTSEWNEGEGFTPIGKSSDDNAFHGSFDGQGYNIQGVYINRPSDDYVGLFSTIYPDYEDGPGIVKNLNVINIDVTAQTEIGGLSGHVRTDSTVENIYVSGKIESDSTRDWARIGGAVGYVDHDMSNIGASVDVTAEDAGRVGGLFGRYDGGGSTADVSNDMYATGDVTGDLEVGGLVGALDSGEIAHTYAIGSVSGNQDVGGLVGQNSGDVSESYWDTESTGLSSSAGDGTGLTTEEMQGSEAESNMGGFDFTDVWGVVEDPEDDYPVLQALDEDEQLEDR